MLIKIEAIINEEKFQDVLDALNAMHVNGITVSQVMGCGTQHGLTRNVRGSAVEILLLPKIKLEIVVSSEKWEDKVIQTIRQAAYTGQVGDGKIFSYEIRTATKIRTNETGQHAIWADVQRQKYAQQQQEQQE
ncbi:MAG: P-II family nitrogen regulator [Clostridiales bacterium]|nr:P-II family nitrogen regulator [Clostridiales bacterium]MCD8109834.1 P-II family nitrogen regulator [Clostridiales bacterium]MCD8133557.1 P-II family nitrogen regulator [Clostridiales bacterium]